MRARCLQYHPKPPQAGDLALAYTRRGNNDCGIFYETFKGELKLLHLAFHLLLYSDDVFGELGWISPPIEPETRDAISKICRRFYSKNYDQRFPTVSRTVLESAAAVMLLGQNRAMGLRARR